LGTLQSAVQLISVIAYDLLFKVTFLMLLHFAKVLAGEKGQVSSWACNLLNSPSFADLSFNNWLQSGGLT
jgi:hypothetical protein